MHCFSPFCVAIMEFERAEMITSSVRKKLFIVEHGDTGNSIFAFIYVDRRMALLERGLSFFFLTLGKWGRSTRARRWFASCCRFLRSFLLRDDDNIFRSCL